jgi:nucleotide-binding universal stress UspA family protein
LTIKTILVAVDGSQQAAKSTETAAELAQRCGAKLVVLHVVTPIFGDERAALEELAHAEHMERTEYEMLQQRGRPIVEAAEFSARQRGLTNLELLVEVGDPAGTIISMTRARSADLVVVGRRGRGTLAGLLLGSVSSKVVQLADVPCLVVS